MQLPAEQTSLGPLRPGVTVLRGPGMGGASSPAVVSMTCSSGHPEPLAGGARRRQCAYPTLRGESPADGGSRPSRRPGAYPLQIWPKARCMTFVAPSSLWSHPVIMSGTWSSASKARTPNEGRLLFRSGPRQAQLATLALARRSSQVHPQQGGSAPPWGEGQFKVLPLSQGQLRRKPLFG